MNKIIITADVHFGVANKLDDTLWAMDIIAQYAQKNNIQHILILGDLFHDRVNLRIDVLTRVYRFFQQYSDCDPDRRLHFTTFCGNHDMYLKNSWEINSLEVLGSLVNIYDKVSILEIDDQKFHILPFMHQEHEYMEELSKIQHDQGDILLTHIGIMGATLNECYLLKHWGKVSFEHTKFKRIFTGHFHCHQEMGKAMYPGSPIPFRFDEGVVDHGFLTYDIDEDKVEFVKIFDICAEFSDYKPADYMTLVDENLIQNLKHIPNNNIRLILSKDYTKNELNNLRTLLTKKGAKSISWIMPKREISENDIASNISQMKSPEMIFKSWLEHDKPDLDKELLITMHKQVSKEAEERITVEDDLDA